MAGKKERPDSLACDRDELDYGLREEDGCTAATAAATLDRRRRGSP